MKALLIGKAPSSILRLLAENYCARPGPCPGLVRSVAWTAAPVIDLDRFLVYGVVVTRRRTLARLLRMPCPCEGTTTQLDRVYSLVDDLETTTRTPLENRVVGGAGLLEDDSVP